MADDDASLATCLVEEMPTEATTPTSPRILARMISPIRVGGPRRRRAPATSRKASSMLTCSTIGVTEASTAMTWRDTSTYRSRRAGRKTASGQSRRACPTGMAAWIPWARAS